MLYHAQTWLDRIKDALQLIIAYGAVNATLCFNNQLAEATHNTFFALAVDVYAMALILNPLYFSLVTKRDYPCAQTHGRIGRLKDGSFASIQYFPGLFF
jgi:hypothetical protein